MTEIIFQINAGLYLSHHGYYPIGVYDDSFKGDLNEIIKDVPWDSDTAPQQGRDMKRYLIIDMNIPDIFEDPIDFINNWMEYRYFTALIHFQNYADITTVEQKRKLWEIRKNREVLVAINELLKVKTMRSEFRISLKKQLMDWINNPKNSFITPFSQRQLECILQHNDILKGLENRISPFLPEQGFVKV